VQPEAASSRHADDDWDDDSRSSYRRADRSGYSGYETGEFDEFGADDRVGGGRRGGDGYHQDDDYVGDQHYDEPNSEIRYPGLAALAADPVSAPGAPDPYSEPGGFPHTGQFDDVGRYDDAVGRYDDAGRYDEPAPYREYLEPGPYDESGVIDQPDGPRAQLFGQITIYTLIEGRAADFDRLTEWVVAQVRAKEPDTLVYIVHAVPTAPLQRILYEVYRDRVAHEEHLRRRYVMTYEAEQRPFVLATNVIELGLQQAKVSPLPSISAISDILSESGIDLTGITGSAQPQYQPAPRYEPQPHYGPRPQQETQPRYAPEPPYEPQSPPHPQYDPPYQGWADIRGEDSRY
jgi:quinol monooxygenase YgiN